MDSSERGQGGGGDPQSPQRHVDTKIGPGTAYEHKRLDGRHVRCVVGDSSSTASVVLARDGTLGEEAGGPVEAGGSSRGVDDTENPADDVATMSLLRWASRAAALRSTWQASTCIHVSTHARMLILAPTYALTLPLSQAVTLSSFTRYTRHGASPGRVTAHVRIHAHAGTHTHIHTQRHTSPVHAMPLQHTETPVECRTCRVTHSVQHLVRHTALAHDRRQCRTLCER